MKSDFVRLKNRMEEASIVEPNDFGFGLVNHMYRSINRFFKNAPFVIVVPGAVFIALCIYLIFGFLAIKLASILQNGF